MKPCRLLFAPVPILLCLALAGCSASGPTVTGLVTLDGQPLPDAELTFELADRSKGVLTEIVRTDTSGKFEIKPHKKKKSLPPGKYTVYVAKWVDAKTGQVPPPEDVEMQKAAGTVRNAVPEKYNNRAEAPALTAEIKPGSNDIGKFELKSK
jgi:hypothetical protein